MLAVLSYILGQAESQFGSVSALMVIIYLGCFRGYSRLRSLVNLAREETPSTTSAVLSAVTIISGGVAPAIGGRFKSILVGDLINHICFIIEWFGSDQALTRNCS